MADRHYIYDSEARRVLVNKGLLGYYDENRDEYVEIARELYRTLKVPDADLPEMGDVFVVLFSALKSNATFVNALLEHNVSLERAANKWFSYFSWLIVIGNWKTITGRRRRRNQ